jgi:hypothetical protein
MAWKAGTSGNPKGRPKKNREVQELAREDTLEAYARIRNIMRQKDPRLALQAAMTILERGWGKPKTEVSMTGKDGGPILSQTITDTEAARLIAFTMSKGLEGETASVEEAPSLEDVSPEGETLQ